ncbi:hypothetical protein EWM64_g4789 [Hericium alpestre]|uniref:Fe2OG dioxygenase domain-containing protein n=1 Tax=Hericium alpestre TaxID=135208 RepID=A0A4Y9ZYE9_9AGAM|nr:hypothetical protein EWM64_g4789 [Hericium alpestre]
MSVPTLAICTECTALPDDRNYEGPTSPDSLFDEVMSGVSDSGPGEIPNFKHKHSSEAIIAYRKAPPIPGLFFDPELRLPAELADDVLKKIMDAYFQNENVNQIMLFGRAKDAATISADGQDVLGSSDDSGLPPFLQSLLVQLEKVLKPVLPHATYHLLFPPSSEPARARQAIINLYRPGEGISPHVDLLRRFGDGIIGVSLGSGCVMNFRRECEETRVAVPKTAQNLDSGLAKDGQRGRWDLYLPERSVLVLSDEARYQWTHGIEKRLGDSVRDDEDSVDGEEWMERDVRLSVTFRWLLPGADVVGDEDV